MCMLPQKTALESQEKSILCHGQGSVVQKARNKQFAGSKIETDTEGSVWPLVRDFPQPTAY